MRLEAYSVFDKAVGAFLPPIFVRSRGEVLRTFDAACNDGSHQFARNVSDYTLFFLGYFNDSAGEFEIDGQGPIKVVSALEVRKTISGSPGIAEQ